MGLSAHDAQTAPMGSRVDVEVLVEVRDLVEHHILVEREEADVGTGSRGVERVRVGFVHAGVDAQYGDVAKLTRLPFQGVAQDVRSGIVLHEA